MPEELSEALDRKVDGFTTISRKVLSFINRQTGKESALVVWLNTNNKWYVTIPESGDFGHHGTIKHLFRNSRYCGTFNDAVLFCYEYGSIKGYEPNFSPLVITKEEIFPLIH